MMSPKCSDACVKYWFEHPYSPIMICPGCWQYEEDGHKIKMMNLQNSPEDKNEICD